MQITLYKLSQIYLEIHMYLHIRQIKKEEDINIKERKSWYGMV